MTAEMPQGGAADLALSRFSEKADRQNELAGGIDNRHRILAPIHSVADLFGGSFGRRAGFSVGEDMPTPQDLITFIRQSRIVSGQSQFMALLENAARTMGFDWYASMQVRLGHAGRQDLVTLTNLPGDWHRAAGPRHAEEHPAYLASMRTSVGFRWSDMHRIVPLGDCHREILRRAREMGVIEGFCVPGHVPGEASGVTTFAVGRDRPFPEAGLPMAQLVGTYAFDALRRIDRPATPAVRTPLTRRQRQCTLLAARGRTDGEIAAILGLGEDTVSEYLDAARRRYGVAKRSQLVVRALYDGHFSLTGAMDP